MTFDKNKLEPSESRFRNRSKYYRFNLLLLLATFMPMLSVGLFNYTIDPYDVLPSPTIKGVNYSKPEKLNNTRLFKAIDIMRVKPVTVILGSSRTDYGIDPQHPALKQMQPAYNLAFGAASPYELLAYLKHVIANQPDVKQVVVGLDEFMFNELNGRKDKTLEPRLGSTSLNPSDLISFLFSIDIANSSIQTLQTNLDGTNYLSYEPNGRLNLRPLDKKQSANKYRFDINLQVYFREFPEYKLSQTFLDDFKSIVQLCRDNNIELKVFISPPHATQLEVIRLSGHWQSYENMKREIVKITPVWDFSGYNSVTQESLDNNMSNYIDNSHYRKEIGDLVIARIFNYNLEKLPQDFGVWITPENIENHLQKIRDDREKWAKENQEEIDFVKSVRVKTKPKKFK